jgi:cell division protein FtsL
MAVIQRNLPLYAARLRRAQIPRAYFKLGDSGLIAGAVAIVCILSILFLAQTGRVATAGYELQELQQEHSLLTQEAEQYEYRIARASRLDVIADRAQKLGMRPAVNEQQRYITIELPAVPVVANAAQQ